MAKSYMSPKKRFLSAIMGRHTDIPSVGTVTSTATVELMEKTGSFFPEAHLDPEKMADLAQGAHTILGYDNIAPLFSVHHEAAAFGCDVDWGGPDLMPDAKTHPYKEPEEVKITRDFLKEPSIQTVLEAIRILRRRWGREVAIVGKVFGPWTLSYHFYGTQEFLINTILRPDWVRNSLELFKEIPVMFAEALLDAGADALIIGDHATGDLVSPDGYHDFLMPVHAEMAERIHCPLVLHICGDTRDRIEYIRDTGINCFHYDTKVPAKTARELAGDTLTLMGGVNNTETLYSGAEEEVQKDVFEALDAGIDVVGPECAVPLSVSIKNLRAVKDAADAWCKGKKQQT